MKPTKRKTPGKSLVNTLVNGKSQRRAMVVGLVERNVLLLICFSREKRKRKRITSVLAKIERNGRVLPKATQVIRTVHKNQISKMGNRFDLSSNIISPCIYGDDLVQMMCCGS